MAPDQCIFVSATYDMTYDKEVIFDSRIYRGGYLFNIILYKYKKSLP